MKNDFIREIFHPKKQSVWIGILGKKQFGKTDYALHLMEKVHEQDLMYAFGSNVPVKAPFDIDFIEDFQTLEQRCRMLNPNPKKHGLKRYLFFGSEMGKWLPKDESWKNTQFISKLQTVRKSGLSWIGDAIDRVEGRALNPTHFNGCFTKLSLKVAEYENWVTGERTIIHKIPKTNIEFDTWYSANFYMEPQTPEDILVPLNEDHKRVKQYMEQGSWAMTGIHRQTGKDSLMKVLKYHYTHCLRELSQEKQELAQTEAEIA